MRSASWCRFWRRRNGVCSLSNTCRQKTTTTRHPRLSSVMQCSRRNSSTASGPTGKVDIRCTEGVLRIYVDISFSKSRKRAKGGRHYGGWYYGSPAYECPTELEDVYVDVMKLKQKSGESEAQLDRKRLTFHESLTNFRRKNAVPHYKVIHTLVLHFLYWLF